MGTRNFFGEGSPYLNHPLLTAERTARDVELILVQLELSPGARVLDVGCGPGRHTIELARRGYEVLGIDPSRAMIEAARARAAASDVAPDFRQVGGESFRAEREFDAAICLFTTLGQISEQGENSGLVPRVYDALCQGGYFVVETPQREWIVRHLERAERFGRVSVTPTSPGSTTPRPRPSPRCSKWCRRRSLKATCCATDSTAGLNCPVYWKGLALRSWPLLGIMRGIRLVRTAR
jgi:SAM-dependent methyltransferase